jgi:hypothetical protein
MSADPRTTPGQKILEGARDALILSRVAHSIQSWHCSQTEVAAPCSDDCSCWQSARPIINAYLQAVKDAG